MKILIDAQYFTAPPAQRRGGFYFSTVLTKELLKRSRFEYELLFFDKGKERNNRSFVEELLPDCGVPIHECNCVSYKELQSAASTGNYVDIHNIVKTDFDIAYFLTPVIVTVPRNTARISMFHDYWFMNYKNAVGITDAEKVRYADAANIFDKVIENGSYLFTISEFSKKQFIENSNINAENVFIVSDLYDSEMCFQEKNPDFINEITGGLPYILFIGKLDTKKNLDRIIKAFEVLHKSHSELKLVLIGNYGKLNNESRVYTEMITSSPASENIIVLHEVDDIQKRWFYSGAKLLLHPSLYEGFGITIVEAQACGCPVVTSTTTACPTTAGSGGALLVNPYDLEEIILGAERVLTDSALKNSLVQNGFKNTLLYTPDKCAELVEGAFEEIYTKNH